MARSALSAKKLGRAIASAGLKVAKFAAAAALAAGVGLAILVKKQLGLIDTLAKLSRNLSVSIDDLQAFRLAAEISGVPAEVLDKSLKRMTKSLSDLSRGLSTQVDAFATLGLTWKDLKDIDAGEAFKIVAEQVKLLGISVSTTGAVMDIFGAKVGADLVGILVLGREGIEAFKKEIEDMGLSLSKVDAAKVEAANDAWTRFKGIVSALAQKITVELAPFIEAAVKAITKFGARGSTAGGAVTNALELAAKAFAFVATVVQRLVLGFEVMGDVGIDVLQLQLKGVTALAKGLEFVLDKLGLVDAGWTDVLDRMSDKLQEIEDDLKVRISANLDSIAEGGWGDAVIDKFKAIRKAAQEAAEETVRLGEEIAPGLPVAIEPAVEKVEELAKVIKKAVKAPDEIAEARPGSFGEGDVALSRRGALETPMQDTQKKIVLTLEKILIVAKDPPPTSLLWGLA